MKVFPGVPGRTWHQTQGDRDIKESETIYTFCASTWDDIFTNHPDFFVTERLKEAFESAGVTGCSYVKISHAEDEKTEERIEGNFFHLKCHDEGEGQDVFVDGDHHLNLSSKAIDIVKQFAHEWVSFGKPHDFLSDE